MNGWMDGWIDGWMDGGRDGGMDGRMDKGTRRRPESSGSGSGKEQHAASRGNSSMKFLVGRASNWWSGVRTGTERVGPDRTGPVECSEDRVRDHGTEGG